MDSDKHRNPRTFSAAAHGAATEDPAERARIAARDKRIATMRAQAALARWRMDVLPGGAFEFWRWSRCRQCATLDEAELFVSSLAP